jgi:uncharacterized RDD family membrane protein YckC
MRTTPYAGLVTRALALLVDALVIDVIAVITGAVIALIGSLLGVGNLGIAAALTGGFLWLAWTGLYFILFWTVTGETPGARLLGIRVESATPRPLGIVRASLRFIVMMLALIPLGAGFLTVLFDDRRRGPHDMVAGTVATWAKRARLPDLAASPAPAPATAPAAAPAGTAAVPPIPATAPRPAASPPPAAAAPPPPVVGEVIGPAGDDQSNGRVPPAAGDRIGFTTDQPPTTRFESRPGG